MLFEWHYIGAASTAVEVYSCTKFRSTAVNFSIVIPGYGRTCYRVLRVKLYIEYRTYSAAKFRYTRVQPVLALPSFKTGCF
jgi:hypothetical protein